MLIVAHPMTSLPRIFAAALVAVFLSGPLASSQTLEVSPNETVRVNVTVNPDNSRTVYKFDPANHKATATTTEPDGKPRGKIEYELDEASRFARGQIFGPDGRFRFTSYYKYDGAGRMLEETQRGNDDKFIARIVYHYDPAGKQTGYSIFDGSGKLINRVGAPASSPSPSPSASKGRKGGR
jgi:YD repeat-containing protein